MRLDFERMFRRGLAVVLGQLKIWLFAMFLGSTIFLGGSLWAQSIVMTAGETKLTIDREPLRIGLEHRGSPTAAAHPASALLFGDPEQPEPASVIGESFDAAGHRVLAVRTPSGKLAQVTVSLTPNQADFVVRPAEPEAVLMRL